MNLAVTKLVTMIILGSSSFLVGVSTIKLRKVLGLHATEVRRSQALITSALLCFGAGVLLATSLLHILPEVREGLLEAQEKLGIEYLAELVTCSGFFLVYVVEEVVHATLKSTPHREQFHKALSLRKSKDQSDSKFNAAAQDCCVKDGDCHNDMEVGFSSCHNDMEVEVEPKKDQKSADTTSISECQTQQPDLSPLRDFLTVLPLSFHAIIEGMALGVEKHKQDVWTFFIAITSHKLVICFCLSLELLSSTPNMIVFFSYLITFSIVNSVGIGIGMIISELGSIDEVTSAVLQGLAGGTLLYVVMFEVLQREKEKDVSGILQLFGLLVGFGFMTLLQTLVHEDHDDEGEEEESQNSTLWSLLKLRLVQKDVGGFFIMH